MIDRRAALATATGAVLFARAAPGQSPPRQAMGHSASNREPDETIELWPNGAPGMPKAPPVETIIQRSIDPGVNDRAVTGTTRPRMVVFRPHVPNGAAVLIAPGGGYQRVVVDKEGYETARWLAARGFTAFVLFYRLPGDGWSAGPDVALSDMQRAMRLIRARAGSFGVRPQQIAAMGFSAGGHLCADLVARFGARTYAPLEPADRLSARPFLAALAYPVVSMRAPLAHRGSRDLLLGAHPTPALEDAHSPNLHIRPDSPPCFLFAAEDDETVPVENLLLMRGALKTAGVPVETHIFADGGHGFGIGGVRGRPAALWPDLFLRWAASHGLAG